MSSVERGYNVRVVRENIALTLAPSTSLRNGLFRKRARVNHDSGQKLNRAG